MNAAQVVRANRQHGARSGLQHVDRHPACALDVLPDPDMRGGGADENVQDGPFPQP
jgi:hypothetical protein